jgi:hypothetical protein
MASFKRALEICSDDFLASIALSAEQIEATKVRKPARHRPKATERDRKRTAPITKDDRDLARRVNEFLAGGARPS